MDAMKFRERNLDESQQRNSTDIFCQRCGYVLRHLDGSRCPECGHLFDSQDVSGLRDPARSFTLLDKGLLLMPVWVISIILVGVWMPWRGSDDIYWVTAILLAFLGLVVSAVTQRPRIVVVL